MGRIRPGLASPRDQVDQPDTVSGIRRGTRNAGCGDVTTDAHGLSGQPATTPSARRRRRRPDCHAWPNPSACSLSRTLLATAPLQSAASAAWWRRRWQSGQSEATWAGWCPVRRRTAGGGGAPQVGLARPPGRGDQGGVAFRGSQVAPPDRGPCRRGDAPVQPPCYDRSPRRERQR